MAKVLYIGFGIAYPPSPDIKLGGAIVYQESLAEAVNACGWETTCFFAGAQYTPSIRSRPRLKMWYKNRIKFIELCNSPNIPGYMNSPDRQCHDGDIENLTKRILAEEKPDIVHIHELQMHTASIIDTIVSQRIPVIKTMHNYYDICSQRDLMYKGKELCRDFERGKRCVECLKTLPILSLQKRIAVVLLPGWLYKILAGFYKRIKRNKKPKSIFSYTADHYYYRHRFFVERLNRLDAIHCSSFRSAEIFVEHGVFREKIVIIPNSAKSTENISPKILLRDNRYPVVFGYVSGKYISRGYQVLVDAFSRLDQTKAKLIIWGIPPSETVDKNLNMEFRPSFKSKEINQAFREIDVGVIPSIWEEVFGLIGIEWLTAKIPVIGSNMGGIPDWLKDGENGFLVPPNDAVELARRMELFVKNPGLIAKIQQQIKPVMTFNQHINKMTALYKNVINGRKNQIKNPENGFFKRT